MVFSSLPISVSRYTDNPIVCTSLKIFHQFWRHFKLTSASTMASPLPLHRFYVCFIGKEGSEMLWTIVSLIMFLRPSPTYLWHSSYLFSPISLFYWTSVFSWLPSLPSKSAWEEMFGLNSHVSDVTPRIYTLIWSKNNSYNIKSLVLGKRVLDNIRTTTSCARLSDPFPLTFRLNSFFTIVSDVLKIKLDICPLIAIFGVPSQYHLLNHKQGSIVAFASLIARCRILLSWTSPQPPSISVWLKDFIFFLKLEKVKYNIRGRGECFFEKWQQIITYFNDIHILEVDWGEM